MYRSLYIHIENSSRMKVGPNAARIYFTVVLVICCVLLSAIFCRISGKGYKYKKVIPDWTYNAYCYLISSSEKDIEDWSTDIRNKIKLYNIPVFSGQDNINNYLELPNHYFENNIRKVLKYNVNKKTEDLVFNFHRNESQRCESVANDIPVIVTAGSTKFMPRLKHLFKSIETNLTPHYDNIKIIFYDLGMTHKAIDQLKSMCLQCEYRKFPFHMFPNYCSDDLKNYIWKPLIIHKTLQEFDFVMWVDSSVEFKGGKKVFDDIFHKAKEVGLQLVGSLSIPKDLGPMTELTKSETFRYLSESEAEFVKFPEVEANRLIFKRTPFVMNAIIRPWVGCALTENCMGDKNTRIVIICDKWIGPIPVRFILRSILGYDVCHRFDQSVLSIILTRIFGKYRQVIQTKYIHEWVVNKVDI